MNPKYIPQPTDVVPPKVVKKVQPLAKPEPQVVVDVTTQVVETIKCPHCASQNYTKAGFSQSGTQVYRCKNCQRRYVKRLEKSPEKRNDVWCPKCDSQNYIKVGISQSGKQQYRCSQCQCGYIMNPYFNCNHNRLKRSDDVWSASDLGLQIKQYDGSGDKLNFSDIQQEWLKQDLKKFIRYIAATTTSLRSILQKIYLFKHFSIFISTNLTINKIEDISRSVIIDYLAYLNQQQLTPSTKSHHLYALASFFETGTANEWFNVHPHLIRKEDSPYLPKLLPRYIPDEVMIQLNQHLNTLPKSIIRATLVIQECGLRISELCLLPLNCLKYNSNGGYSIQFMRWKMKKEDMLPISLELAQVIKEQQAYIQQHLGKNFQYLFCGSTTANNFTPVHRVMSSHSFTGYLKRLADEFDIKDSVGKRWNFQSHQFRHTVGTRMINNGVPQHIIQRYLGHESPTMTSVYAHIHDETLRKEIEKFHESTVVNFQGQTVELEETLLSTNDDLEWFKKNIQARALEHGYCGRPKMLGDCDIPGFDGCYNCPHWRTNKNFIPILKDTLERTNKVIEKARNCGWELQVKKKEPIQHNLVKVIASLEVEVNE